MKKQRIREENEALQKFMLLFVSLPSMVLLVLLNLATAFFLWFFTSVSMTGFFGITAPRREMTSQDWLFYANGQIFQTFPLTAALCLVSFGVNYLLCWGFYNGLDSADRKRLTKKTAIGFTLALLIISLLVAFYEGAKMFLRQPSYMDW